MRHNLTPDDIKILAPVAEQFHRLVYTLANTRLGHHPEIQNRSVDAEEGGIMVGSHEIRILGSEVLDYTAAEGGNPYDAPFTIEMSSTVEALDMAKSFAQNYPSLLEGLPRMNGNGLDALFNPIGAR